LVIILGLIVTAFLGFIVASKVGWVAKNKATQPRSILGVGECVPCSFLLNESVQNLVLYLSFLIFCLALGGVSIGSAFGVASQKMGEDRTIQLLWFVVIIAANCSPWIDSRIV